MPQRYPLDLRQLRYFIAVAEQGSISAAAIKVHIAQPALTRQIHALEEGLELPCFIERRVVSS